MTQRHTATLTMRRSLETIGNTGTTETENLQFETLILNEVINDAQWVAHSMEEGEPVDVSSFRDAVAAGNTSSTAGRVPVGLPPMTLAAPH